MSLGHRLPPAFWFRPPGLTAWLLAPLGLVFALATLARPLWTRTRRAPLPVLCLGNVALGGGGKTPLAAALARLLAAEGLPAAILSRGHGGRLKGPLRVDPARHSAAEIGDEPRMLALGGHPVVVADRRAEGAAALPHLVPEARVILLDDGAQDPALHKDMLLMLADGTRGFGNGFSPPAGPCRLPPALALARADALLVTGDDRAGLSATWAARLPMHQIRLEPVAAESLRGRPVLAFAGIARPERLAESLRALGAEVTGFRAFPDHHPYTPAEIRALKAEAGDRLLVTTAKDHARLDPAEADGILVLRVEARITGEAALLARILERLG